MIRQGWPIVLASLCLVFASGCAPKKGWQSFPVKIYADPSITSDPSKESDLRDAMSFWEDKAGHQLFDYQGAWTEGNPYSGSLSQITSILANVVVLQNPWPLGANVAGQTLVSEKGDQITGAVILINGTLAFCNGDCAGQRYITSQRKDFAHELGHFLGLQHVPDVNNIMYPVLQPGGSLSAVTIDQNAFDDLVN